jgi:hypothetical protein
MRIITNTQTYDVPGEMDLDKLLWTSGQFQYLKIERLGATTVLVPVVQIQRIEL